MFYLSLHASAEASYQKKLTATVSIGAKGILARNATEFVEEGRKRWTATYSFIPSESGVSEKVWKTTIDRRDLESMPDVFESDGVILIKFRFLGTDLFNVRSRSGVWKEWEFDENLVSRFPMWAAAKTPKDENWVAIGHNSVVDVSNRTITVEYQSWIVRTLTFRFSSDGEQLTLEKIQPTK